MSHVTFVLCIVAVMLCCHLGWSQPNHKSSDIIHDAPAALHNDGESGWKLNLTASSTLGLGARQPSTSKVEIPWRPLDSAQLAPQRLEAGVSYHFGPHARGRVDLGLSLFPQSSYQEVPMELLYESQVGRDEIALGELSTTLPISSSHSLTLGRVLYRLDDAIDEDQKNDRVYHVGDRHNQPLWSWEERYWSWAASPLERWVSGLSIGGIFWRSQPSAELIKRDRKDAHHGLIHHTLGTYRINIFTPHERVEVFEKRGLVLSGMAKLNTPSWSLEGHGVWGYHLSLNPKSAAWADQQLKVAQTLYQISPLASREIRYRGIWWRGIGRARLYHGQRRDLWVRASINTRYIRLNPQTEINRLEESALSESNTLGDGRSWSLGVYGVRTRHQRDIHLYAWSIMPHRWGIDYLARDPHLGFGYDERHRLRANLTYIYSPSWGRLSVEFWYTHLWSAAGNRSRFDSDIGGISLEMGTSVF